MGRGADGVVPVALPGYHPCCPPLLSGLPRISAVLARLADRPAGPLALLWLWALRHGPVEVYDSARYLHHAAQLVTGRGAEVSAHSARYVGYALYLSGFLRISPSLWLPVFGQVLLSALTTAAYFSTVRRLAGGAVRPAALATALTLAWPDLQRFSAYILTESLFASAVLFAGWALARAAYAPRLSVGRWLVAALGLAAVTLARPNGFLVPAAAAVAGLAWVWRRAGGMRRVALALGSLAAALAAWPLLNAAARTYHLIETYGRGAIISGYKGWLVRPDAPLVLPPVDLPQLHRVAAFAAAQPGYFARLAGAKVLAFVAYVKPFWSSGHIALAVLVIWPAWVLAVRGLRSRAVPVGARWFTGALLGGQAAIVAFTVEDWDARFLTPLLPLVFGLAALGGLTPGPSPKGEERLTESVRPGSPSPLGEEVEG